MTIEFERGTAYVVDRGTTKLRTGSGLLNGLDVVIRHFRDALTRKIDNPSQTSGVFTVQYPEERTRLPEAFRNFPILLYEDESGQELCTSCFQCERICPPQVIHMTQAHDPATGKPVPAVTEFLIEYDACMSCGLCAEVCPFDAIKMDHEFELATDVHGGLTWNKEQLNRPVSYYERLAPTFWAEVKDGALKKLQGNVKRRSGLIGVAPQVAEKLRVEGRAPRTESSEPRTESQGPRTEGVPVAAQAPAGGTEAAPPDDKAARLAAIRARNAAKVGGDAPAPEMPPPVAEAAPAPAADDKAARLAAIRARNAAKAAGGTPAAPVAAEQPAAAAPLAEPAPAAPEVTPAPADDKAARLAAIRAKNAAAKAKPTTPDAPPPTDPTASS